VPAVLDGLAVDVLVVLGAFGGGLDVVWLVGFLVAVVVAQATARRVELRQIS
jgi:hypothetical protein